MIKPYLNIPSHGNNGIIHRNTDPLAAALAGFVTQLSVTAIACCNLLPPLLCLFFNRQQQINLCIFHFRSIIHKVVII